MKRRAPRSILKSEELDDIVRQVDAARVQVNLPTPPPTLPSDDGDWDQGEERGDEGSEDEARREVEAGVWVLT